VRGTVTLGGEAGNVAYDPAGDHRTGQMLADVQTLNQLAVINPATLTITRRLTLLSPAVEDVHPAGVARH
jgi:hypothetical protein